MTEKLQSVNQEVEDNEKVSVYDGMDRATLNAIAEATASAREQASDTPYADLRGAVREALEESGDKTAFRRVYNMDNQGLDAFVEGVGVELKDRRVGELRSIIDAYDNNATFGDRRTAIREALEAAGDAAAFRTVFNMNNLELTDFVNDARHKLEDETRMDESEAIEHAYSEYEEREGTPYDVDKGRIKDIEEAKNLAAAEKLVKFLEDNPDKARENGLLDKYRELVAEVDAALAKQSEGTDDSLEALEGLEAPVIGHEDEDEDEDEDSLAALDGLEAPVIPEGADEEDDDISAIDGLEAPEVSEEEAEVESSPEVPVVLTIPEIDGIDEHVEEAKLPWYKRAYYRVSMVVMNGVSGSGIADRLHLPEKRSTRVMAGIGMFALAAAGGALYWKFGISHGGGSGSSADAVNNLPNGNKPTTGGGDWNSTIPSGPKAPEVYPLSAHTVNPGEGWYEAMSRAGIKDSGIQHQILQNDSVMQKLHDMGLAYKAPELGGWGLNMPSNGKMPDAALDILTNAAK